VPQIRPLAATAHYKGFYVFTYLLTKRSLYTHVLAGVRTSVHQHAFTVHKHIIIWVSSYRLVLNLQSFLS